MKIKNILLTGIIFIYVIIILLSFFLKIEPGMEIGTHFIKYSIEMFKILPFAFILIGLFEVWVKKETVEKHLGKKAGPLSYIWVLLLGSTTIGPMLVALPVAHSLYHKGARLSIIFTYLGAAAVCRIPMTLFEASYLGIPFTLIRYGVSIPLIIFSSIILGYVLEKHQYKMKKE